MKKEDFEKVQKQYATYQKYKKMYQDLDSFYSIDYEKINRLTESTGILLLNSGLSASLMLFQEPVGLSV